MRPLHFLLCVGKAVLKAGANLVGLGEVVDQVWDDWNAESDEAARKSELQALVSMAVGELRQQVEAVVREVAGRQPVDVQRRISECLRQVPDVVRDSFRRPEDEHGRSVPPGLRLRQASDLAPLLVSRPVGASVSLQFSAGPLAGQTLTLTEPTILLFGRDKDCEPVCPREDYPAISRHHTAVEINPPDVCVRDLGSRNGTYVNDHLIGKRPEGTEAGSGDHASPEHPLAHGDEVRLTKKGLVAFRVEVTVPKLPDTVKLCAGCAKEVADEPGANRPGEFVCAACRGNAEDIMRTVAEEAEVLHDYVLGKELGHGGMGAVYLARHARTNQPVAVKLLLPKVAADAHAVALFQREIRNTMALQHRHVVKCLDHGFARGSFFLVLEYCDGGSVAGLMKQRSGTLPADEAIEITLQTLDGLAHAHAAGLVHRDLKPANLLLTGSGSNRLVKVADYGLAKAFAETGLSGGTRTGEVGGTWAFMCRRQVIDYKRAKPEVDVWSLAATLYNLLTGQVPRDFSAGRDPWLVVLESDAVPIRQRNAKVPARIAEVTDEALREEPAMPFQSAAAFRQALEAAL